jgi:hypothetical protein
MVECIEYAKDVGELIPTGTGVAALRAETQQAVGQRCVLVRGSRIRPATWVVIALAIPVLCWDVWQTERDVTLRRQASLPQAESSTSISAPAIPRPGFRPW